MILLDTNVMSESLRHVPEHRVIDWIDAQAMETLFLSAITVAELQAGVALLPPGKRRAGLQQNLEKRVLPLFAGCVLPVDLACTQAYAALMAKARSAGQPVRCCGRYCDQSVDTCVSVRGAIRLLRRAAAGQQDAVIRERQLVGQRQVGQRRHGGTIAPVMFRPPKSGPGVMLRHGPACR